MSQYKIQATWRPQLLNVSREEYYFYGLIVAMHRAKMLNRAQFLSAEAHLIVRGFGKAVA